MAQTIVAALEGGLIEIVGEAIPYQGLAFRYRQPVQQLQRLLYLQPADDAGDGRCGGHFARLPIVTGQVRATVTPIDQTIVVVSHSAFVAGAARRNENLDDAADFLNAAVDPRRANLPTATVQPQPGLAVVERADDHIDVAKQAQTKIGEHVAMNGRNA